MKKSECLMKCSFCGKVLTHVYTFSYGIHGVKQDLACMRPECELLQKKYFSQVINLRMFHD